MVNINTMDRKEMELYIKDTEKKILLLTQTYSVMAASKIKEIKKEPDMSKRAYKLSGLYKYSEWVVDGMDMNDNVGNRTKVVPKRGEIWTCELGQNIGSEENKIRPVIIIQNNTGNQKSPTTIVIPISNRPKKIAVHICIRNGDFNLVEGETIDITGTVLAEQIRVVSKARLGRHVATLTDRFIELLDSKIKVSISL